MMVEKKVRYESVIFTTLKYLVLVFFAFWTILPLVSCIITALKNAEEYQSTSVMVLPKIFYFKNFLEAFKLANMGRAFLNSFVVLVCVLAGSIIISSQLAYILNRFRFPGNTLIRRLFLFATLLPGVAMQVSVYSIMGKLGFINHLYGYIILMMGTDVISIYIFIQFMENISVSLDESAIMDGASFFKIYWKIILPLLKPATITTMILKGVGCYNEYYCANLYLQDMDLRTVAISLYTFTGPLGSKYNLICAGVIISMIPAFIVFILCQKHIYSGITSGAVKG
jgi:multiple sugar transport system permease protein